MAIILKNKNDPELQRHINESYKELENLFINAFDVKPTRKQIEELALRILVNHMEQKIVWAKYGK